MRPGRTGLQSSEDAHAEPVGIDAAGARDVSTEQWHSSRVDSRRACGSAALPSTTIPRYGELDAHDEVAAHALEDSDLGLRDDRSAAWHGQRLPNVRRRSRAVFGAGVAEGRGRCIRAARKTTVRQFSPRRRCSIEPLTLLKSSSATPGRTPRTTPTTGSRTSHFSLRPPSRNGLGPRSCRPR